MMSKYSAVMQMAPHSNPFRFHGRCFHSPALRRVTAQLPSRKEPVSHSRGVCWQNLDSGLTLSSFSSTPPAPRPERLQFKQDFETQHRGGTGAAPGQRHP